MFLRRHRKIVDQVSYDYWSLCESVRTAAGPRQRVVASLGKLTLEEARPEAGWEDLRALLEGRPSARQLHLGEEPAAASGATSATSHRAGVTPATEAGAPTGAVDVALDTAAAAGFSPRCN